MNRIIACALAVVTGGLASAQQPETNTMSSAMLQAESVSITDAPRTVGRVPVDRRFAEPMGIYVERAAISGGQLMLTLRTDLEGPFDIVYGDGASNGLHLARATFWEQTACVPWTNAVPGLLHVQVGVPGSVSLEEDSVVTVDRARMFHYAGLIDREYFYCTKFHRYNPGGAGVSYFSSSTNGLEAIVFPLQPRAVVGLVSVDESGTRTSEGVCELSYAGQEDYGYGVGERIRVLRTNPASVSHQRAFSASPLRSDAKIIRLSGGGGR